MESGIVFNHQKYQHHHKLRFVNSFYYRKTFVQPPRRTQQRLIPLTLSIRKLMMDFNASSSSSQASIPEKQCIKTISITRLVRREVQNILQDLSISDQFIHKEEIDDLIEKCLRERVTLTEENDAKLNISENEQEQVVEVLEENDINKLIIDNFQILEHRITNLEERLSTLLQTIPKLSYINAKQFKINTNAIKEVIRSMMEGINKKKKNAEQQTEKVITPLEKDHTEQQTDKVTTPLNRDKELTKERSLNIYDEMYYTRREYCINLLNYKKSLETIKLNEKSVFNPYVKPCHKELPQLAEKLKRRPMFLTTNEV